ncbi:hypothetical protein SLS53_008269 [Cytospora paraplurivora]|uniref:hydroxymethylglutaryl-CoA lyase n=1 Tax=Cytospora paraplurivora TaxID=2898453 RepID=A0AAN9YBN3_9PEZI
MKHTRPIPIARHVIRGRTPRSSLRRFATATDAAGQHQYQQYQQQPPRQQQFDNRVRIVEVGPRDGLQNEKKTIPLATKIELIERLAKTGLTTIEAGSFVSPKWVPQMANSNEILSHVLSGKITSPGPIRYSFLAPNLRGLKDATAILDSTTTTAPSSSNSSSKLAVFAAATETFSQKNLNSSISASLNTFREVIAAAKQQHQQQHQHPSPAPIRVRAYISVVLGCPFEGRDVDPHRVAEMATDLLGMGADEIALGDTTGMGTAPRTAGLLRCMAAAGIRSEDVALHFHDTYGQALVNTAVALEHGIRTFDSAVAGLGGCPYSPGATGNVATEDVVYFLESLGMETGVDLDAVADVGQWITGQLGKANDSAVGKAVLGARKR